MKVILKEDLENLGNAGDIKEVKKGYARNYLIPRGFAYPATPSNIKAYEELKRQQSRKILKETKDAQKLAEILQKNTYTFLVKAGEEGKIYGSVTSQMIYDMLVEKGFSTIEKKKIHIPEHIKSIGEYEIGIKLYSDVIAKVKINVISEDSKSDKPEDEVIKENIDENEKKEESSQ